MAKSSINFQKSKGHSYDHNFRKDEPNYLLKAENRLENFYWQNERTAREIFNDELKEYGAKKGKRPRFENSHWEAVLNLNKNHTLEDAQKVAEYIEQKFNITCATIAVHRDEGHYKNDKPQYNFHAHITFVTVKDGQQNWSKEKIKPSDLAKLQTEVAEILQMERGKTNSEAERLSAKQYKKVAQKIEKLEQENEQLKAELLTLKEQNERIEKERKDSKGQEYSTKAYHSELGAIKKNKQRYTAQQLEQLLDELKEKHKRLFSANHEAVEKELINIIAQQNEELLEQDQEARQLKKDNQAIIDENGKYALYAKRLEEQKRQLSQQLEQQDKTIKAQNVQILELEAENNELKEFIQKAFKYIRIASKSLFDTISNIFSSEFTAPLLNEPKKDEESIDQSKETQQRSNLTPLQPENNQEQKQDEQEQQSDEEKTRKFKPYRQ
jgi:mobilization protein